MFVKNLTDGSVLLPNGRDLITWLEITEEEAIAWKFYDGNLFKISKTKPTDSKESNSGPKIEDAASLGGVNSLAEALKTVKDRNEAPVVDEEAKREEEAVIDAPKPKKEKKVA